MGAQVTRTFGPLGELPITSEELMREVGDLALRIIRTRTESGRDVHGQAFQPLSAAYGTQKEKALGHRRADLTVSGRMLNDMGIQSVTRTDVTLAFRSSGAGSSRGTFIQRSRSVGAADKAYYHHVAGAGRSRVKREFFDLSETEMDEVEDLVARYLERALG